MVTTEIIRRLGERIVVHERSKLFKFDVERAKDDQYTIFISTPLRKSDGSNVGVDQVRAADFDKDRGIDVPFDGSADDLPSGNVHISITNDDGVAMHIRVAAPKGWTVVAEETFIALHHGK